VKYEQLQAFAFGDANDGAGSTSVGSSSSSSSGAGETKSVYSLPFPYPVASFPVERTRRPESTDLDDPKPHTGAIPAHLPPFPPARTYKRTHENKKRTREEIEQKIAKRDNARKSLAEQTAKIDE
jgi:Transcription factor TFIID complex subunit 8 C-term